MASHPKKLWLPLWLLLSLPAYSAGIQNLTFTEVVKDVMVIDVATKKESPAKSGDVLVPPNVLKTGADSRAELVAEDKTVTRVGANTIFSVEADSRDVNLEQGSVLFNSPKGRGGGRIKSAGATASVLGTTIQVGANSAAGGMKVMVMEGKAALAGAKGGSTTLNPGQLSFVKAGAAPSAPLNFDLKANLSSNKLVGGFSKPLASIAKIEAAASVQQAKVSSGALSNTGLLIGNRPDTAFQVIDKRSQEYLQSLKEVLTRVVDQIKVAAEDKTPSRSQVDPRYLAAVAKSVSLANSNFTPADSVFSIDGSGVSPEGYSIPSTIPGDRQKAGTMSALIANNFSLSLAASAEQLRVSSFLNSQLDQTPASSALNPPLKFDAAAIVALNDINLSGNVDLVGLDDVRTVPSITGANTTKDSKTVSFSTAYGLEVGMTIRGSGIPEGSRVVSIDLKSNALVLSLAASETSTGLELTTVIPNATAKQGSKQVTVSAQNSVGLIVGMEVREADYFPNGATITEISSDGTQITLSESASESGSATLNVNGFKSGIPILLSAGRTLNIAPGSTVRADTSLFEIYAAGLSFSSGVSLSEVSGASKVPLVLDSVHLYNEWGSSSESDDGMIRIKAPSMDLIDAGIRAGKVVLEADGAIRVVSHGYLPESTAAHPSHSLPLGFSAPSDLQIRGYSVSITSKASSVTLGNIGFAANEVALSAENDLLTLSGVTHDAFDSSSPRIQLSASAKSVLVKDSSFPTLTDSKFTSTGGDIKIEGSAVSAYVFGSNQNNVLPTEQNLDALSETTVAKTFFKATSAKALTVTNYAILADRVELKSVEDLTFKSVDYYLSNPTHSKKVDPAGLTGALFSAVSTKGNVKIGDVDRIEAAIQAATAGGRATLDFGSTPIVERHISHAAVQISAARDKEINLFGINFSHAQNVALDAATVILTNVRFMDGSTVNLNSQLGMVAAKPGTGQIPERGYVNFVREVYYGPVEIKLPSAVTPLNNYDFQTQLSTLNLGDKSRKITIGTKQQ